MITLAVAPTESRAQASGFLHALFDDKPSNRYLLIWTLPGKHSAWFQDLDQAAEYARRASEAKKDVYIGVSLSHLNRGPDERGKAADSSGIVGLWADVDVGNHGSSKKVYPPDQDSALSILAGLPAPTIVVHSGHGLQPWWLFKEPWIFESTPECKDAMILAKRWTMTIQARARVKGWDVDSTGDLARVLRLPGTTNWKDPKHPVPVTVVSKDGPRYNPTDDFDEYLVDVDPAELFDDTIREGLSFIIDPRADPPFKKLGALIENDAKFRGTWERKRADLPSASEYDLALADAAAMAGWGDQEIIDLLIAWRRKHGEKLQLRPSKYAGALSKARKHAATWGAPEGQLSPDTEIDTDIDTEIEPEATAQGDATKWLRWLQQHPVFRHVPIAGARKLGLKHGQYELLLDRGRVVELGTAEDVLTPKKVQGAIADVTAFPIQELKRDKWRHIARAIFELAGPGEDIGIDPETEAKDWLSAMVADFPYGQNGQVADMANSQQLSGRLRLLAGRDRNGFDPHLRLSGWFWTTQHELCVHAPTLVRFVTGPLYGGRTTHADARVRLRRLGFRPVQLSARDEDGCVRKGRLWISPRGFDPDE